MLYVLGSTTVPLEEEEYKKIVRVRVREREGMMREGLHFMTGWPSTIGSSEFTPQQQPLLFQYQVAKSLHTSSQRGLFLGFSSWYPACASFFFLLHCETIE